MFREITRVNNVINLWKLYRQSENLYIEITKFKFRKRKLFYENVNWVCYLKLFTKLVLKKAIY